MRTKYSNSLKAPPPPPAKFKRTLLCVAKPSYLLTLLERSSTRSNYLKRLPKILRELLRQRN
ncbi:hypothetical protein YC2023_069137 [Brassica napus]